MAALRHPNVVLFLGACPDPPCMVTAFCARGSLLDVLARARASPVRRCVQRRQRKPKACLLAACSERLCTRVRARLQRPAAGRRPALETWTLRSKPGPISRARMNLVRAPASCGWMLACKNRRVWHVERRRGAPTARAARRRPRRTWAGAGGWRWRWRRPRACCTCTAARRPCCTATSSPPTCSWTRIGTRACATSTCRASWIPRWAGAPAACSNPAYPNPRAPTCVR